MECKCCLLIYQASTPALEKMQNIATFLLKQQSYIDLDIKQRFPKNSAI